MNYEITVVIPVYNQLSRLKLTIQGFLDNEKFESIQIIVVDDGSTEDISDYIYSLGKHNIRCIVNTENKGRAFARNIVLKKLVVINWFFAMRIEFLDQILLKSI